MQVDVQVYLKETGGSNVEITQDVLSVSISKGKSRQLDYYQPASATIVLNNYARQYDPTNASSPYNGLIFPKKAIEVWSKSTILYSGLIDNWSFIYDVSGNSIATVEVTEFTGIFANQYLKSQTFPQELSGSRINRVLNDNNVAWSTSPGDRLIDAGVQMLDADTVDDNTNVLDYLRSIEASEQGAIFAYGNRAIKFEDASRSITSTQGYEIFADDGSVNNSFGTAKPSVPYSDIRIGYDSTLIYNSISVTAWDDVSQANAEIPDSQADYAINKLSVSDVIYANTERLSNLATFLGKKYSQPEYRVDALTVDALGLGANLTYDYLINTQLNQFAKVIFTPNGIGSKIERFVRIIGISHDITPGSWLITYNLESIRIPFFVLDDATFGKLDSTYVLGL